MNRIQTMFRLLSALSLLILLPGTVTAFELYLGTAQTGSFSHYTGRLLGRTLGKDLEGVRFSFKILAASGDIHNLTNVQQGSLDLAVVDSRMLFDAVHRTGRFQFLDMNFDNVALVGRLFDMPVTLVTVSGSRVSKLADLAGKRVNAGAPLSLTNLSFETILSAKSWSHKDFLMVTELSGSQSQDTMAFCHGNIDAMFHRGIHPNARLGQLLRLCNGHLADMDDDDIRGLIREHPAFYAVTIPAGTYPEQAEAVSTFGTRAFLVASRDLDDRTVFDIADLLIRRRSLLSAAHPALEFDKPDDPDLKAMGIPFHPGAEHYFSVR